MLTAVLDVLFPPRCAGCGGGPWPLCRACLTGVAVLGPPGCARCSRPLELDVPRCSDCPPTDVSWARAGFLYEGPARSALLRLKFSGLSSTARALAPWMVEAVARFPPPGWLDDVRTPPVVTWVPLGRRRRRARGYDQARALAVAVAASTGWPVRSLLVRSVETVPQARRAGPDRWRALRGAFSAVGSAPDRVLLVDDVLTTGATAAAAAAALRAAGAGEVGLLTAARSVGGAVPARCYHPAGLQPGSVVARENLSR